MSVTAAVLVAALPGANAQAGGLTIAASSLKEGNTGTRAMMFRVSRAGVAPTACSFTVTAGFASSSTASANDLSGEGAALPFVMPAGQSEVTVAAATVVGDLIGEPTEVFNVTLGSAAIDGLPACPVGATKVARGRITNDDDDAWSIGAMSQIEGDGLPGNQIVVPLTRLRQSQSSCRIVVRLSLEPGDTASPAEFDVALPRERSLVLGAATTTSSLTVARVVGDVVPEVNETFTVAIRGEANATTAACRVKAPTSRQALVVDDDGQTVSIADTSVVEGDAGTTAMSFRLTLTQPATGTESVRFTTSDGTATAGSDYAARDFVVTFNAGQTSRTVNVNVTGDTSVEPDETLDVLLSEPVGLVIVDGAATGTITNDESGGFSIASQSVAEPPGPGARTVEMAITRPVTAAQRCNVQVVASFEPGDTASAADVTSTLPQNFLVNATSTAAIVFPTSAAPDLVAEGEETFTVTITGVPFSTIPACEVDPAGASAKVTIVDAASSTPRVSISEGAVVEGPAGTSTNMLFTVTLSSPAVGTESVTFTTVDSSAVAPGDYTARTAFVVTFNPGQTTRNVGVTVRGDGIVDPSESFRVILANPVGLTLAGAASTLGRIIDDD